eukprot:6198239-Pleurochrysis_carterae.AAC.4
MIAYLHSFWYGDAHGIFSVTQDGQVDVQRAGRAKAKNTSPNFKCMGESSADVSGAAEASSSVFIHTAALFHAHSPV